MNRVSRQNSEFIAGNLRMVFYDTRYLTTQNTNAPMHTHSYFEMFYVLEGSAMVATDQGRYSISKNDLYIIPPGLRHCRIYTQREMLTCRNVALRFNYERLGEGEDVFSLVDAAMHRQPDLTIFRHSLGLRTSFEGLLRETHTHAPLSEAKIHALLTAMLLGGIRLCYPALGGRSAPHEDSEVRRNFIMEAFFSANYASDIRLGDLAEKLNLSVRQTSRVLKEAYGESFQAYLTRLRVQRARNYLMFTDLSVSEIAQRVGYSTPNGLITAFQSQTNSTPADFRLRYASGGL